MACSGVGGSGLRFCMVECRKVKCVVSFAKAQYIFSISG